MQLKVSLKGLDKAARELQRKQKRVAPVLRGALNTTATKARAERYVKPLGKTLAGKRVRAALRVKRARRGMMNSRIIPSSAGVPVALYKAWGILNAISPTRASIWVVGPNGKKQAAGFINPASSHKLPLGTKLLKKRGGGEKGKRGKETHLAHGPSVAHWFRGLSGRDTQAWVSSFLQDEFQKRMQKELAK